MSAGIPAHVLATLDEFAKRRRHDGALIQQLALAVGVDPAPWLDDTTPVSADTTRDERRTKNKERRTKGKPVRPTGAPTETQQRILEALKAAGEPVAPGALAKALKMDIHKLRYHTKALIENGSIEATGKTANRVLSAA